MKNEYNVITYVHTCVFIKAFRHCMTLCCFFFTIFSCLHWHKKHHCWDYRWTCKCSLIENKNEYTYILPLISFSKMSSNNPSPSCPKLSTQLINRKTKKQKTKAVMHGQYSSLEYHNEICSQIFHICYILIINTTQEYHVQNHS